MCKHLLKNCVTYRPKQFFFLNKESTCPGCSLPAAGLMLISPSLGRAKENSLGGTGVIPSFIISWLVRKTTVLEQSLTAVSLNRTREWESSKGGWTPDPWHDSRKSLIKRKKLFNCTVPLDLKMWTPKNITSWLIIYHSLFTYVRR